ncbi:MAG: hypothetical protein WC503_03585 [Candidatus Shapirobacteria bacterium]
MLSLSNQVEAKIIDRLVSGTLNRKNLKDLPGISVVSDFPLVLRYQRVENNSPKNTKPSIDSKK